MSDCGLFDGEVFVDEDGTYVGDFSYTDGPGGPFGWLDQFEYCEVNSGFFSAFNIYVPPTPVPCGLPQLPVLSSFPVGRAYTVADSSGPIGLEALPAMRVDLQGTPQAYLGWGGPQVVDDATGDWKTGLLGGDVGWKPLEGETWVFSCWAKLVPDAKGVVLDDAVLRFDRCPVGFSAVEPPSSDELALTEDWQFYMTTFDGVQFVLPAVDWWYPLIGFHGASLEHKEHWTFHWGVFDYDRVGYAPYGSVLVKCAHLYPVTPSGGNWIDSFHGHG